LSTKEIKFVCISELDTNLLVDNVHPSFAGVVLFSVIFHEENRYTNNTFCW